MLRPEPALLAHEDPVADLAGLGAHRLRHGDEGIAHEDGGGVGVVEDIGHLLVSEAVIHRRRHRADRAHGGGRDHAIQRVVLVDDDVVAAPDAERAQREGQAIAPVELLGPGESPLALDQRDGVRLLGGIRRDKIHQPSTSRK
jgi:hypothetical protein